MGCAKKLSVSSEDGSQGTVNSVFWVVFCTNSSSSSHRGGQDEEASVDKN